MKFSDDILDHIFSFLRSQKETLVVCSKVLALSRIVERHLFYHTIVQINRSDYVFEENNFSDLVSEKPHILNYVRILEIQFVTKYLRHRSPSDFADKFPKTLLMFPLLECIMLKTPGQYLQWYWSADFQAALENRLNLPTMKEVHFMGTEHFPYSLFNHSKNIKHLSLSGSFPTEGEFYASTLPQLESLTLSTTSISSSFLAWLKLHSNELRSLKCSLSFIETMAELLGVCSGTLNKFHIDVANSQCRLLALSLHLSLLLY